MAVRGAVAIVLVLPRGASSHLLRTILTPGSLPGAALGLHLDTGSELTLIPEEVECHQDSCGVRGVTVNRVLAPGPAHSRMAGSTALPGHFPGPDR